MLVRFFGFILTLGVFSSRGSSSSSFPISTFARDSTTGSMSSPRGATHRCRVFLGLHSALLCHPRFPIADTSSRKTVISIIHIVGLCRFHFSVQVEITNVIFEIDWSDFFYFHTSSPISENEFSLLDQFCCESCNHHYVRGRNVFVLCTRSLQFCTTLCLHQ